MSAPLSTFGVRISDVSGQKRVTLTVEPSWLVQQLLDRSARALSLPTTDADGRPIAYAPRLERLGRHPLPSERLDDAGLEPDDDVVIQPSIDAGAG